MNEKKKEKRTHPPEKLMRQYLEAHVAELNRRGLLALCRIIGAQENYPLTESVVGIAMCVAEEDGLVTRHPA